MATHSLHFAVHYHHPAVVEAPSYSLHHFESAVIDFLHSAAHYSHLTDLAVAADPDYPHPHSHSHCPNSEATPEEVVVVEEEDYYLARQVPGSYAGGRLLRPRTGRRGRG